MKTSLAGLRLIKKFEGLRLKAYICPAGVLTIGYGSTGAHVKPEMVITAAEAEALLIKDLARFENAINRLVKVPLNQNQFDALASFIFNIGIGAFEKSTLLRILNTGNYNAAADQFGRWTRGGGVVLEGLVKRRKEEKNLFLAKVVPGVAG